MQSVDKDSNVFDDKKEEVVTTPLTEKKSLTTEKVTTSDEVNKHTEKFKTSEEVVKGTEEVQKRTGDIITNEDVDKGTGKLEYMKEAVFPIRRKDFYKFKGQSKGSTGWFNVDNEFQERNIFTLEPTLCGKLYEKDIEGPDMEQYKCFSHRLIIISRTQIKHT